MGLKSILVLVVTCLTGVAIYNVDNARMFFVAFDLCEILGVSLTMYRIFEMICSAAAMDVFSCTITAFICAIN